GRYGLSAGAWAKQSASVASSTTMPHNAVHPIRIAFDMTHLSSGIAESDVIMRQFRATVSGREFSVFRAFRSRGEVRQFVGITGQGRFVSVTLDQWTRENSTCAGSWPARHRR